LIIEIDLSGEGNLTHRDYQELVAKILSYYGFIVRTECWISIDGEFRRLDVCARCGRKDLCGDATVAVEISLSSRLEKDLHTIYGSRPTYGFVLAIKPITLPSLSMGNIFVVNSLEDLENRLREVLRTPSSYPKTYPGILNEIPKPAYRDLDEAFETFQIPPKLRLRARYLLLHTYTTCYELYTEYETVSRGWVRRTIGDEEAFTVLKQLDLAYLERRREYVYVVRLTDAGYRIAKIEAEKHVIEVEKELKRLTEEYGWVVALLALLQDIYLLEHELSLELLFEELPFQLMRAVVATSAFYYILKDKSEEFLNALERLGVAFRCRIYGDKYRINILPEAREMLFDFIIDKISWFAGNEELVKDLVCLKVFYRFFPLSELNEYNLRKLYENLHRLEISLEDMEKVYKKLPLAGIASPFNKDKPPYALIYNRERFRERILEEIRNLYTKIPK